MKKFLFALTFMFTSLSTLMAQDTVYLDKSNVVVPKNKADQYSTRQYNDELNRYILKYYDMKNNLMSEACLLDTIHQTRDGYYLDYYSSGQLKYSKNYDYNLLDGKLIGYYENGIVRRIDFFKKDTLIEGKCFSHSGEDTVYFPHYVPAGYASGNLNDFTEFLSKNIVYPNKARKKGIQGRVYVNFIIEKNGSISNVVPYKPLDPELDKEAVRVIKKSSGLWAPAYFEGKAARVRYTVPINFKLN